MSTWLMGVYTSFVSGIMIAMVFRKANIVL